jgi:hypothetical protein
MISIELLSRAQGFSKRYLRNFRPIEPTITYGREVIDVKESLFNCVLHNTSTVFAITADEVLIGFFGVKELRKGVLELWVIRGEGFDKHSFGIVKEARRFIKILFEECFRIEMAVLPRWGKWAKTLGFEFEHICQKYDGILDHDVYVRFE